MSFSDVKALSYASSFYKGAELKLDVTSVRLAPGEYIQGEVIVSIPSSMSEDGLRFFNLRLSLLGRESNAVRDDQAEYEALLEEYTADRTYLSRHVTLAGCRRHIIQERMEVEEQAKQELLYSEHHATPYKRVAPPPTIAEQFKYDEETMEDYESDSENAGAAGNQASASPSPEGRVTRSNSVLAVFSSTESTRRRRAKARVLKPGTHRFPFGFRLPPWLPPSYYYDTKGAEGKLNYYAEAVLNIVRDADNYTDEKNPNKYTNSVIKKLSCKLNFFVLSTISKRQLMKAYHEAQMLDVQTSSTAPADHLKGPIKSTRFQLFHCGLFGNLCCFNNGGCIEVEIELRGPRALLTRSSDALAEVLAVEMRKNKRGLAGRKKQNPNVKKTKDEPVNEFSDHEMNNTFGDDEPPLPRGKERGAKGDEQHPSCYPAEFLPITVRVRNENNRTTIPKLKIELVEMIDIFKPLETTHKLDPPLSIRYYTKPILPGQSLVWETKMTLPKAFRRCKNDGDDYLPPPGVQTVNIKTYLALVVKFPKLHVYVEEELWDEHVLQLAEVLDSSNQVLNLPVKYA